MNRMLWIILVLTLAFSLQAQVYINEVDYDQTGTDTGEFIELVGPDNTSLDGYAIELVNGSSGAVYLTIDLTGQAIPADNVSGYGFFVISYDANPVANTDLGVAGFTIQNGAPDGLVLKLNGTVVDGFSYEGAITNNADFTAGMAITPEESGADVDNSLGRLTLGFDANNQNQYFAQTPALPSPGEINTAHGQVLGADTPPVIFGITRTPFIPAENENTTISADVTDDSDVALVELRYWINDGDTTAITMSISAGNTYTGDIPEAEYLDGDVIGYLIYAEDDNAQGSESSASGFLAGTTPIGTLHLADANGAILYDGLDARVTGVATVSNGTYSVTNLDVYVQDATGGVNVFAFGVDTSYVFTAGNSYTVVGEIDQFNGKTEIIPGDTSDITDNGPDTVPAYEVLTLADLLADPEAYEGTLVAVENATNTGNGDTWPDTLGSFSRNIEISDDGGTTVLTFRIDDNTSIIGTAEPTWPVAVGGIFSQFDNSAPYDGGYQLLPRGVEDVDIILVSVDPVEGPALAREFRLHGNYPNPFNPSTNIRFDLVENGPVSLVVFNALGQKVRNLVERNLSAGSFTAVWNGMDNNGNVAPSGIYFAVLQAGQQQQTIRMTLLK
ncbi:MAG TPA: FlgD immunoglobulin-like domain containing protein [Calditrichia bacterium]|nr:T9SS type A sorting domain-containing protein [Calditrichota bacterium]HQU72371.1 FlgD immunoglobulin-like domain containing protein [Calditrichia bacterium]HQV33353.1 FlgD immunoglobulin-like domain containing protein [Calditrichia bacterium]